MDMKTIGIECDVENLLRLIGGRWKVLLLRELAAGPCRHGQLLRALPGITQKMLTQRLRELEGKGLLDRRGFLEGRVKVVEYSLTPWGKNVMSVVFQIHDWAVTHRSHLAR
jgi:DNA-binding HxlR family transcriptional regulator